jgi:hypothetical protein
MNNKNLERAFGLITEAQKLIAEASRLTLPLGFEFIEAITIVRRFGVDREKDDKLLRMYESLKAADEKAKKVEEQQSRQPAQDESLS